MTNHPNHHASLNVLSLGGASVGRGTPMIRGNVTPRKKAWVEKLLREFDRIHGGAYIYSHMGYTTMPKGITPICRIHGPFKVQARAHIQGACCPECDPRRVPLDKALERFRSKYGDKYDYSKVRERYVTFRSPAVEVICRVHGSFLVKPINHWKNVGEGCASCASDGRTLSQEEVVRRITEAGQGHLLPSDFKYTGMLDRTRVVCPRHGEFYSYPVNLQRGIGCGACSRLSSDEEAAWVKSIAANLQGWGVSTGCRIAGVPTEIDAVFTSPSGVHVGVEYDGSYWHGMPGSHAKDVRKTRHMKAAGMKVVRLRSVEKSKPRLKDVSNADANFHVGNRGPYEAASKKIADHVRKLGGMK